MKLQQLFFSFLISFFLISFIFKANLVLAKEEVIEPNYLTFLKQFLEETQTYKLFPNFYINLVNKLAAAIITSSQTVINVPPPMKDLSSFNLAIDRYYIRPWETSGLVECEPWGVGKGKSICLAPVFPGDPPCPIFMDCDGDGHYWWKGEDCDENCPTCYVGSKFYTSEPDGRDEDCDGLIDDNVECIPKYGDPKPFGYDQNCNFNSNTNYTLVNEGEVGEIPLDKIHCQKRWGQCTDYQGGFGNCTVSKTPGYFVKSSGIACGGGIWRLKGSDSLFDCGKALRSESYKGTYGCNMDCCKYKYVCEETGNGVHCFCTSSCVCEPSPCSLCKQCEDLFQTTGSVCLNGCQINATFEDGKLSTTQYGPWALCHGYNQYLCQPMIGCERRFVENKYY